MVKKNNLNLELKTLESFQFKDYRGEFTKIFSNGIFQYGFNKVDEFYYSISNKDVIRGMHFQLPPFENYKLVHVIRGSIEDVVLDLRKESQTYLQTSKIELNEKNKLAIIIPPGIAHGFKALEDNTTVVYLSSQVFSNSHDSGIKYNSFNYNWGIKHPIVSGKDKKLLTLNEFLRDNPF